MCIFFPGNDLVASPSRYMIKCFGGRDQSRKVVLLDVEFSTTLLSARFCSTRTMCDPGAYNRPCVVLFFVVCFCARTFFFANLRPVQIQYLGN